LLGYARAWLRNKVSATESYGHCVPNLEAQITYANYLGRVPRVRSTEYIRR
jgi:hypothetical protein